MILSTLPAMLRAGLGWLLLLVGVSVFAIRFQHEGAYAFPREGNLRAGVLALAFGLWFVRPQFVRPKLDASKFVSRLTGSMLVVSPVVLFFALYATLAELEEVVVLRPAEGAPLRLWIVDHEGTSWVTMSRPKADAHDLRNSPAELLRHGETSCVIATRSEVREEVERTFRLRSEKYRVQRLAISAGLFEQAVGPTMVALRLDPCPP